jgi:AcrR family transcriptional regulator
MGPEVGLRERKKQQTRQLIADTARHLFSERGFDDVSVVEIARAAEVSEATVFNYFPTKEDLIYHRMEAFEAEMLQAIEQRQPGESVVGAFGRFVTRPRGFLESNDEGARQGLETITRIITNSTALLAREREIFERYTRTLADLIAQENAMSSAEVEPWVFANALIGLHRAMLDYVRRQVLAGVEIARIAGEVEAQGKRALARLEQGFGNTAL